MFYRNFVPKTKEVFEIFDFKNAVTLKPRERSLMVIESGTIQQIDYGFLLVFYRNFVHKIHIFEKFTFEKYHDLENGVRGH